MTGRERLHPLVDELPEGAEALELISALAQPDDGRLNEDELAALRKADVATAVGKVARYSARRAFGP